MTKNGRLVLWLVLGTVGMGGLAFASVPLYRVFCQMTGYNGTIGKAVTEVKKPESIITWGITDRSSWISGTFKRQDGLPSRPLPLDADYKAKPMMRVLEDTRRGRP